MKDFKGGNRFGGGNDRRSGNGFGGGNRFGGSRGGGRGGFGGRGESVMHEAKCDECGKRCEVPFRPTGEKPVYCNECFGGKRDGSFKSNDRGNEREDKGSRDFSSKPSYSKSAGNDDKSISELKKQIETINSKLDAVIKMIQSTPFPTAVPAKKESLKSIVDKAQNPGMAPLKKEAKPEAKKVSTKKETKAPAKTTTKKEVKKVAPKKVVKKAAPKKKK